MNTTRFPAARHATEPGSGCDYEDGGNVWDMVASGAYLGLGIKL